MYQYYKSLDGIRDDSEMYEYYKSLDGIRDDN